jgi:hypothetical protein
MSEIFFSYGVRFSGGNLSSWLMVDSAATGSSLNFQLRAGHRLIRINLTQI